MTYQYIHSNNVYYVTPDTKNVTQISCHKSMCILHSGVVAEYCDA